MRISEDIQDVEDQLGRAEQELEFALLSKWKRDEYEQIETAARRDLEPYKEGMGERAYDNTLSLITIKKLRDSAGIPRLGLYYV